MMLETPKSTSSLPSWLLLPLGLGIMLLIPGVAMPWLYPQQSLWTNEDASRHQELATQAHAVHHAAAHAQTKKLPTIKEDAAKARWYREQFDRTAERLLQVREGGSRYGQWLIYTGLGLTAIGVVAALSLKKE